MVLYVFKALPHKVDFVVGFEHRACLAVLNAELLGALKHFN